MIKNLVDYFADEQEFYLDKIMYNRIDKKEEASEYSLNCTDGIEARVDENILKLIVTRELKFVPEEIFALSVSFGVILKFKEEKKKEYDWENVNIALEFRENGEFVLANIMSRISLLIAEITASFGQSPIVLPPGIAPENN